MNNHAFGCQCGCCFRANVAPNHNQTYTAVAYATSFPAGWHPQPYVPQPPFVAYAITFPPSPQEPPPQVTITTFPESPELVEIRKLREEVAKLAKTQAGMMELVKRALAKGRGRK